MVKTAKKGDMAWYLPNSKRPFAYSTRATSDLIAVLYEMYGDLQAVYDNLYYDEEAKAIVKHYLDNGYRQANIRY
jgi:hypothetical protein